jgi:histidinol-phosphate aminotransferase
VREILSFEDHGGLNLAELEHYGISPERLIDFSVNSNPFGPAPAVLEAIRTVDVSTYPDRQSHPLREALAEACVADSGQILVGNGTAELIWLTVQALVRPGERVLLLGPTFGEYRRAAEALGARVDEVRATPPDFQPALDVLLERIEQDSPRLVFVCNPNNPTGSRILAEEIQKLTAACGDRTLLVLDEAYRSFVDGQFFSPSPPDGCLILRSMTKDFAMAGVRLGYALGKLALIEKLARVQPAWSVNAFAQTAGLAALQELAYYRETLRQLLELKTRFFSQLSEVGFAPLPSDIHFGILPLDHPAREIRQQLLNNSIQVRDCTSFGLPQYIRISTRREADNLKLVEQLSRLKQGQ